MSSRVLRKLQGEKDFLNDLQDENSDPESDLEGSGGAKKKQLNVNRYDLVSNHIYYWSNIHNGTIAFKAIYEYCNYLK